MKVKGVFRVQCFFIAVILLLTSFGMTVGAASPIAYASSINVRTAGSYTFNGGEFVTNFSVASVTIKSVPVGGELYYYSFNQDIPLTEEDITNGITVPITDIQSLKYFPDAETTDDSFTWSAANSNFESTDDVDMTISVFSDANNAPVSQNYIYSINKNIGQTGTVFFTDADGDEVSYTFAVQALTTGSTFELNENTGGWSYTNNDVYGTERITITATETTTATPLSSSALITIYVNALNVPQTLFNATLQTTDASRKVAIDIPATVASGAIGISTIKSPTMATIPRTSPSAGVYRYTYTLKTGTWSGADSFIIRFAIPGGGITQDVTVNVYVNAPPVLSNYNVETVMNTQATGTVVATGNADGDTVTYAKASDPAHGTATVSSDGSWTYNPTNGYIGNDSFTVGATDNHDGSAAVASTINMTVIGNYAVTFNSKGGSAVEATNANAGTTISQPSAPTKTDYIFGGWYKETECINAWNFASDVVTEDTTLYAAWTLNAHSITTNVVGNGSISPQNPAVIHGASQGFTILADSGNRIKTVTYNGGNVGDQLVDGVYTATNVVANGTLNVEFEAIPQYTVTVNAGSNGTVVANPANRTVYEGETVEFTITPAEGYLVNVLTFEGNTVTLTDGKYTTLPLIADATLVVTFTARPPILPSITTANLAHLGSLNLSVKTRGGDQVMKAINTSFINYATISNPDNYELVAYGMFLKDLSTGKVIDLPVRTVMFNRQFAVHVFGDGFVFGHSYTLQGYLKYKDKVTSDVYTVLEVADSIPFMWQ